MMNRRERYNCVYDDVEALVCRCRYQLTVDRYVCVEMNISIPNDTTNLPPTLCMYVSLYGNVFGCYSTRCCSIGIASVIVAMYCVKN